MKSGLKTDRRRRDILYSVTEYLKYLRNILFRTQIIQKPPRCSLNKLANNFYSVQKRPRKLLSRQFGYYFFPHRVWENALGFFGSSPTEMAHRLRRTGHFAVVARARKQKIRTDKIYFTGPYFAAYFNEHWFALSFGYPLKKYCQFKYGNSTIR